MLGKPISWFPLTSTAASIQIAERKGTATYNSLTLSKHLSAQQVLGEGKRKGQTGD